jgi:hypothetical protein
MLISTLVMQMANLFQDVLILAMNIYFNDSAAFIQIEDVQFNLCKDVLLNIIKYLGEEDALFLTCCNLFQAGVAKNVSNTLFLIRAQCALQAYSKQYNYFASQESVDLFGVVKFQLSNTDNNKAEKVNIISNQINIVANKKKTDKTEHKSSAVQYLVKFHLMAPSRELPVIESQIVESEKTIKNAKI